MIKSYHINFPGDIERKKLIENQLNNSPLAAHYRILNVIKKHLTIK